MNLDDNIFNSKEVSAWRRLLLRTLFFALLTGLGFAGLELLVYLGREQVSDINDRFPELVIFLRSATILAWAEISVMWIRIALQPQVDVQAAPKRALESPIAASIVYLGHLAAWALRIVLLLGMSGFLK